MLRIRVYVIQGILAENEAHFFTISSNDFVKGGAEAPAVRTLKIREQDEGDGGGRRPKRRTPLRLHHGPERLDVPGHFVLALQPADQSSPNRLLFLFFDVVADLGRKLLF